MTARAFLTIALAVCSSCFRAKGQSSAIDSLRTQLENHTSEDTTRVRLLNRLAVETYFRFPEEALHSSFEARTISENIGDIKGEAESYRQAGLVFWSQASYASALETMFNGLKLIEGNPGGRQVEADLLGNIGMVYNSLANYSQALEFLTKSLEGQRALKNSTREAAVLNNIGDSYRLQQEFEKAIDMYSQALKLRLASGNIVMQGTNLRNIGNVYEAQGNLDKALEYYLKSLDISVNKNDRRGIGLANQSIASVYSKKKDYPRANKFAFESLKISRESNLKSIVRDDYKLMWQMAEEQKKIPDALTYFKQFTVYKDSVENMKVSSEISTARLNYEMQKKQTEIDLLKKDGELQNARIIQNNTLLATAIFILLMAIFLFVRQRSISRLLVKKNKEIQERQKEITEQNDELIALNEEIRSQQDEVTAQRDALTQKNHEILVMNIKVLEANENLEKIVAQRTAVLEEQNQRLSDYAFHNAHKLRAPLASILGLVNLMCKNPSADDFDILLEHLKKSSEDLDRVVRSINKTLQQGLDAFPVETSKTVTSRIE